MAQKVYKKLSTLTQINVRCAFLMQKRSKKWIVINFKKYVKSG